MKVRTRNLKKKVCMLIMLSFLACTLIPLDIFKVPLVNADAQEDLNNALDWAKEYLDRSYTEFGTTSYNRIANPGFEDWTGVHPDYWNVWPLTYTYKESSIVHSGSYSLKLLSGPSGMDPGTSTVNLPSEHTYYYSVWIRYDVFPSQEYRIGISTKSKDGIPLYIEMGVAPDGDTFACFIENPKTPEQEYIYSHTTHYGETGVWTNWNITITDTEINWYYGDNLIGQYWYYDFGCKPMTPDIVLPLVPPETGSLYVDDAFFGLSEVESATMRDLPGLPFVLQDVTDDKWMCPAKATQAVQDGNDGPNWGYYGGCSIDPPLDYGFDSNTLKLIYRWDTECDGSFDGVTMYVELITLDDITMKCWANITAKTDSDHCALWLDNETVIDPVTVGAWFNRTQAYGWFTTRFVVRHGTKIAANMYDTLGESDKAEALLNMWYGSGYTKDAYDGIWGASNGYDDYSVLMYPWAADPSIVPDNEVWGFIPWFQMNQSGTLHSGVPYRSQLHNAVVRMLGFTTGPPITPGVSWWENGFTYKMAWACHLLNKYNTSDLSKLAEAKQLIDDVSWNGLGINCETVRVGPVLTSIWTYNCYVPYADAEYLAALIKYYELTGDEEYGKRADEVAGILLRVQVKPGDKIRVLDSVGNVHLIWRPDHTGGFMCGYEYGGGFDFGSSPWALADAYFWLTSSFGVYNRDYPELSSCGWTNHETTLMCYAALYQYKQSGRTPLTSEVDFTLPFFDATVTTDYGGTYGSRCGATADNHGNLRMYADGVDITGVLAGEGWAYTSYAWNFNVSQPLNNVQFKLSIFVPYAGYILVDSGGNSFTLYVEVRRSNGELLVSDQRPILNGVQGGPYETYKIYTDLAPISTPLMPDIYTVTLTLKIVSKVWKWIGVGMRADIPGAPTCWYNLSEPCRIESFGCCYNVTPTLFTPRYYVHIRSSGPGTVYPYGEFVVDAGTIVSSTATPIEGYYFRYWNVNNTRLGYSKNYTSNPLHKYINHDYNITAYFGDTPYTPPETHVLAIFVEGNGTVDPPEGFYEYEKDTVVTCTAYAGANWYFSKWLIFSNESSYYVYTQAVNITMNNDYGAVAYFLAKTKVKFAVKDGATYLKSGVYIVARRLGTSMQLSLTLEGNYWMTYLTPATYDFYVSCVGYYTSKDYDRVISSTAEQTITIPMTKVIFGGPPGFTHLLDSEVCTIYAAMPYSNETQYADLDHYIRVEVLPGTNGTLKLVIHYDTDYPIVEIESENLTLIEFDLEALYQHYCLSSYKTMQQAGLFTGLKILSNVDLQINLEMPSSLDFWHRPTEFVKIAQDGTVSSFTSFTCADHTLTLVFSPGDPTVSMLFHAVPDSYTLIMWNLIPFIFIIGSVVMLVGMIIEAKHKNVKEFVVLLVGFLIVTTLIPIVPQLMA